jgi:hypothetical protein
MNDTSKPSRPSRWPYMCAACGQGFGGLAAFDAHRPRGKCIVPAKSAT